MKKLLQKFEAVTFKIVAIVTASFVTVLSLHGLFSFSAGRGFELSSSEWNSYNLLAGTNRDSKGKYNTEDLELAGFSGPNKVSHDEASKNAVRIALERISASPSAFIGFSLTAKINSLWDQRFPYQWSVARSPVRAEMDTRYKNSVFNLLNGSYTVVVLLVIASFLTCFRKPEIGLVLVSIPLYGYAIVHLLVEVQGRYQMTMTPLLVGVAGQFVYRLIHGIFTDSRSIKHSALGHTGTESKSVGAKDSTGAD